jgi:inhibitor of KinA sporulation pathway (predicted exonuclease)
VDGTANGKEVERVKDRDSYRTDRLLVVDLEMTCWDGAAPPGEQPDIIEIGIAEVDNERLEIARSGRYLVRPVRSAVSAFCTELTGITAAELKRDGRPFPEVRNRIVADWAPRHKTWTAWGKDHKAMAEAAAHHGVASPFSESHIDLGHLFDLLTGASQRIGLRAAMESLGIPPEGERHRAVGDALDAARVYLALARRMRG